MVLAAEEGRVGWEVATLTAEVAEKIINLSALIVPFLTHVPL